MATDHAESPLADIFGPSADDVAALLGRIDRAVQHMDDLAARIEALEISPAERRKRELGELDRRIVDFLAAALGREGARVLGRGRCCAVTDSTPTPIDAAERPEQTIRRLSVENVRLREIARLAGILLDGPAHSATARFDAQKRLTGHLAALGLLPAGGER